MDATRTSPQTEELELDLSGLLGSGQVFAAGMDAELQAELIEANCNKIGTEGGGCIA